MRENAPVLLGDTVGGSQPLFSVHGDIEQATIEVAVHGRWSRRMQASAATGIGKCFAESPRAVIIDLHELDDPLAASAVMWWTTGMRGAALHPPTLVVLCLPTTSTLAARLQRLGAKRSLPVYATMAEARTAIASRLPLTEREQLRLDPTAMAPAVARDLAGRACRAWSMTALLHPSRLVMSELVLNAVEHARTPIVVTVSKRGDGLHLAVADADPRLPRLRDPMPVHPALPLAERGHGLRTVHAAATVWGAMPTRDGKLVWATLRHPELQVRRH
jgi:hypothetical protein